MTFLDKILQALLDNSQKTDVDKICELLHIPRSLREYDSCDFTKETNNRLIRIGLIGHYKITDSQKVEFFVNDVSYCIRIICRTIRRGENGEAEIVNAELSVPFFEFEQDIDNDARMEENIRSVIDSCNQFVYERNVLKVKFENSPRPVDFEMKIEVEEET